MVGGSFSAFPSSMPSVHQLFCCRTPRSPARGKAEPRVPGRIPSDVPIRTLILALIAVSFAVRASHAAAGKSIEISFEADGRHFTASLEAIQPFAPGARTVWIGGGEQDADAAAQYFGGH